VGGKQVDGHQLIELVVNRSTAPYRTSSSVHGFDGVVTDDQGAYKGTRASNRKFMVVRHPALLEYIDEYRNLLVLQRSIHRVFHSKICV